TLQVTFDVDAASVAVALPAASISDIENFELRNISGLALAVDFASIVGEETVVNDRSVNDVNLTNLAAGTEVEVRGNGSAAVSATGIGYATGATAAAISFAGPGDAAAGAAAVTVTGPATLTSATISGSNGENTVAGISLASTDRKSTRLNSSHVKISYAVFC